MRILVFTSRYTASRDIINENFGRQVRLFEQLAKSNEIDFFCADYKKLENKNTNLHGIRVFIRPFSPFRLLSFLSEFRKILENKKYDMIVAASDPLWGVIGYHFAGKYKIKFVYDIQDDYRIYKSYKIPFFGLFERNIVRNSDLVMCASNVLVSDARKIRNKKTIMVPNGVDTNIFKPMAKQLSRKKLKLPLDAKIISYIGSVQKIQGVDILMEAFEELKKEIKNIKLLIVGRIGTVNKENFDFNKDGIIYLGSLPQKDVVFAINASDAIVIPYPKNIFTNVMFAPYKLVEFLACNKPVVITDAGEMQKHIKDKRMVAKAGNVDDLKEKIKYALKLEKVNSRNATMKFEWKNIAKEMENNLLNAVNK